MQAYTNICDDMMRMLRKVMCLLALCGALAGLPASAREIYLAPDGDDMRDGSAPDKAVSTLQRSLDLAAEGGAAEGDVTTIVVSSGIYRNQSAQISPDRFKSPVVIKGTSDDPLHYPAFLGDGLAVWLTVNAASGRDTGLTVQNLRIADYGTALTLNGHRDDLARFNSGTTIIGNVFSRIGSRRDGELSTAAIRMVNSRNNIVRQNYFMTISSPVLCEAMHALYLAHYSSGNRIEDNSFDDFCGSAIKLRDRSNNNEILRNRFATRARIPVVEEWYCDRAKSSACTKTAGECPSTGNVTGNNRFIDIAKDRRMVARGGTKRRDWCERKDFSDKRLVKRDSD